MSELGISQLPIRADNGSPHMMLHESDILQGLLKGKCKAEDPAIAAATGEDVGPIAAAVAEEVVEAVAGRGGKSGVTRTSDGRLRLHR